MRCSGHRKGRLNGRPSAFIFPFMFLKGPDGMWDPWLGLDGTGIGLVRIIFLGLSAVMHEEHPFDLLIDLLAA